MKNVILYGNCHMAVLKLVLERIPVFAREYRILETNLIQNIASADYFKSDIWEQCDVFIHQDIQLNNKYGVEYSSDYVIRSLKKACRIISVPNLYGLPECFFPQHIKNAEPLHSVKSHQSIFLRDAIIENVLRSDGLSVKRIERAYKNANLYESGSLEEKLNLFFEKVGKREENWDVKILRYIKDNYKEKKLFYDVGHPSNDVIYEIALGICNILDLSVDSDSVHSISLQDTWCPQMDGLEMPISNSVKYTFGIKYVDDCIRENGIKLLNAKMGLREYILQYCSLIWLEKKYSFFTRAKSFGIYGVIHIRKVISYFVKGKKLE